MKAWLSSTLQRQYATGGPQANRPVTLVAARGERLSIQACVHYDGTEFAQVKAIATAPDGISLQMRRVGNVPMPHRNTDTPADEAEGWDFTPGYVPDPLFPGNEVWLGPEETGVFWITVDVARDVRPGEKKITVVLELPKDEKVKLQATLLVSKVVIGKRQDFRVGHWFGCDSLADFYKVEPFEEKFWPICESFMKNYAAHGNDAILTPVFTPPTDGVKRPTQLLRVKKLANGKYSFDWKLVKRYVDLARKCGIPYFQWTHLFTQWGCANAIRIYEKKDGRDKLLWAPETGATSKTYRNFLSQYLPALQRFLTEERIAKKSYFSVSDEPHGEQHLINYRAARAMLSEIAPWMKVCDALSDIRYGREHLVDLPVPICSVVEQFIEENIDCWTYYCCGPRGRYINRGFDTPLWKQRMLGWVCHRVGVKGFMHWGYNYWYEHCTQNLIDPFQVSDGRKWPLLPYGDTFVVYPSPEGTPIDSLRWEVFAESMQDLTLLQTLGIERGAKILAPVKNFEKFPREKDWVEKTRKKLLF